MTIRSKHGNLLNYFIHDKRDLSPAYVASCEKFLKEIKKKKKELKRSSAQAFKLDKLSSLGYYGTYVKKRSNSNHRGPERSQ